MKKPEMLVGLFLLLLHTLVSGILQILALFGPSSARPTFLDYCMALEFWAGSSIDQLKRTDGVFWLTDFVYRLLGRGDPLLASHLVSGALNLLLGGAFYFAVGLFGTALIRLAKSRWSVFRCRRR